jgi:hypothetical protein
MGFAANAIVDVVAPPPPARGSNASADNASAPSFQDHVDASDQRSQRSDPPRAQRETHISSDRSSSPPPSDQASAAHPDTSQHDAKQDADTPAAPINPPVLVQLIANTMPAMLGAKAEQPAAAQQEAASTDQAANAGAAPAAALVATTVAPTKIAPKSEAAPRMAQVKTAKGATAKTSSATDDANTAVAQTPAPTTQESTTEPATTPSLTAVVANSGAKSESPNADGVEAVTSGPTRSAQQSSQHAPPASAPAAPQLEATPQQPDAAQTQTKARDGAKASAPLDALKQAVQDLAPAAPKAQSAPSAAPPAATHAQLAEPVQQAASDTSAARAAPAAAQVGGEIIRRFNGHDTSFQLRLDPPELGRVDVRLDVSRDHRVTAVISADSPQALSDLTRGARDLQQALQSAGLDLADDGLRFDLSSNGQGNSFAQAQAQQDQANVRAANAASAETPIAPEVTVSRPLSIDSWRGSRVDLVA